VIPGISDHLESINKTKGYLVLGERGFIVDSSSKFDWFKGNSKVCSPVVFFGLESNFV
jgi:hypothetical protein